MMYCTGKACIQFGPGEIWQLSNSIPMYCTLTSRVYCTSFCPCLSLFFPWEIVPGRCRPTQPTKPDQRKKCGKREATLRWGEREREICLGNIICFLPFLSNFHLSNAIVPTQLSVLVPQLSWFLMAKKFFCSGGGGGGLWGRGLGEGEGKRCRPENDEFSPTNREKNK